MKQVAFQICEYKPNIFPIPLFRNLYLHPLCFNWYGVGSWPTVAFFYPGIIFNFP